MQKLFQKISKNSIFGCIAALSIFLSVFGIAYASVDSVEMAFYQAVNDTTAPKNASDYTKTAGADAYLERQWNIDDANLDVVWKTFRSRLDSSTDEVFVVVIEKCIDLQHSDLQGQFFRLGYNISTDEEYIGGYLGTDTTGQFYEVHQMSASEWKNYQKNTEDSYDKYFHGSHVAGIVGAKHDTNGIAGCSKKVNIIPLFMAWPTGEDAVFDWILGDLYNTIQTRTGKTPRIIVQMAVGPIAGNPESEVSSYNVQVHLANYSRASDAGVLIVESAGNDARDLYNGTWNNDTNVPVTIMPLCGGIGAANFISVAAHGVNRTIYPNSNYSTSGSEAQVHLSAPGWKIISLGRNNEYWVASGTSMASPHVSGTAALLWQLFPDATAAEIKTLILEGAKVSNSMPIAPHAGQAATTIGGYVRTGFLDAAASVKKSKAVLGDARGLDIEIPVKELVITPSAYGIVEGDTAEINVTTVLPYTADNKNVTFTSSNPAVASVTTSGGVHTITTGSVGTDTEVEIYATAADGNGAVSNTVTVTVTNAPVPATSIAIKYNGRVLADNETVETAVGSSITLEPTVEPSDASVTDSDFEWDVDPDTFHTQNGRNITITPSETGVHTITVTVDSLGVRCRLNVVEREPEGIDITDTFGNLSGQVSVQEGGTVTLQASVTPANAAYSPSDIRWTVTAGNASLSATTGERVTVTGRSAGTVTVRASIGSYETSYNITVTAPAPAPAPADGGGGGGCNTGPATGLALLIMSIIPMFVRKKS